MKDKKLHKNIKKRLASIFLHTVLVLMVVPLSLTFMFSDPMVQTVTARLITRFASEQIGNNISVGSIQINIITGITLKDIKVDDHRGNPIIRLGQLLAKPKYANWSPTTIFFLSLEMDKASFVYGKYKDDDDFAFMMLLNKFSSTATDNYSDVTTLINKPVFSLKSNKLILTNSSFHYFDEDYEYDNGIAMDYSDILIDSIQLTGEDFYLKGDKLNCKVRHLVAREQCGIIIDSMSVDYSLSATNMGFKNAHINTNNSYLDVDFEMRTQSYATYSHFIDSVVMVGFLRPTNIDLMEVGYFSEIMFQMPDMVGVTGSVYGTVKDLMCNDVRIHYGERTRFNGEVHFAGLPDTDHTLITATIRELTTTACDLKTFKVPIEAETIDVSSNLICDELITVDGNFTGYLENFNTDLRIKYMGGRVQTDLSYHNIEGDSLNIGASLLADSIMLGSLLQLDQFMGLASFKTNIKASSYNGGALSVQAEGFFSQLEFYNYIYKRIGFDVNMHGDDLAVWLRVGDKHLMMNAHTEMNLGDLPRMNLEANIIRADLDDINLLTQYDLSMKTKASFQIKGFDLNTMTGWLRLDTAQLTFGDDSYPMNELSLEMTDSDNGEHRIELQSDYGSLKLEGQYQVMSLSEQFLALINHYYNIGVEASPSLDTSNYVNLSLVLSDASLIHNHIVPGLDISPGTTFKSHMNFDKMSLSVAMDADEVNYMGVSLRDNKLKVRYTNDGLELGYNAKQLVFKDSTSTDKTVFGLDNMKLAMRASDNKLNYGYYWENTDSLLKNQGALEGKIWTLEGITQAHVSKSELWINDTLWSIDTSNLIVLDSSGLYFKDIEIYGGVSRMMVSGIYPQKEMDSLRIEFDEWNLSNFDMLTQNLNLNLDGIINGYCNISILSDNLTVISDITINGFVFNDEYLGEARLFNTWDNVHNSVFVKSQIVRDGLAGKGEVFSVDGYYYPFREEKNIDLNIAFNRFKIRAIEPFLKDYVSQIEGLASGEMKLNGSLSEPILTGNLEMRRSSLLINYLNTKYSFSNSISFEQNKVNFDELIIYDTLGNNANINGSLSHRNFKDPNFNVEILTDKFLFFNTTRKMNDLYYGTAIMSGKIGLKGSPDDIKLQIDAQTGGGTDVSLPLEYSVEISDKDYIIFVKSELDSIAEVEAQQKKELENKTASSYEVAVKMGITPDAKVTIYLPSNMGRIESEGRGDLALNTNSAGDLSLVGDYNVEKGFFHFTIGNLVSKRFELVEGGRISWTGDPYEANVNISGLYKVKANLNSLGIAMVDDSSSLRNRVNVECYVVLSNQLLDPDISFKIKMPELDPDLKRLVYAELDTTNVAMMNQQMISLLVLGTFSYSNASNLSLSSSYYSVLTNQLSGMLSQISDAFDIGVNYKPGDQISQEEFEVALSTQLFDDRLTIDGNFGLTYDRSGQNASNIVGDVDVGYKLTKSGQWVLKAFNHSNTNSWYNYAGYDEISPYTQGIGIAFRKEFNNIAELFQRNRPRKPKDKNQNKSEEGENTDAE